MTRDFVHRRLPFTFIAAVAIAVALLQLASAPLAGQAPGAKAGATLRTPWGEPDLQGIWSRDSEVPLQRPAKYANREFLTDAERAALDKQIVGILGRDASEGRRQRGTDKDVGGAYNAAVFTSHLRTGRRTSLIVDPPDGRIPPLTEAAKKRDEVMRAFQLALLQSTDNCKDNSRNCAGGRYGPPSPRRAETSPMYVTGAINRADNPEDRTLGERCMGGGLPDFGGFRRIVQSPGQISVLYDVGQGQAWQRHIPITTTPHLPSNIRQWWGDSRGHWEGGTLVVDITNFSPKSEFQGSREHLHLVERWTRLDADTVEYAVTIEDPTVWTKPWTIKQELHTQSGQADRIYYEPRCHEGNYGLAGLLVGERAADRMFAEGKGPDPATRCIAIRCGGFNSGFAEDGEDADPRSR